jgi:predicted NBD/HSP70 family sugar kinase
MVIGGRPLHEPKNLGAGWVGFDFRQAFGCPVKIVNDAAMQAPATIALADRGRGGHTLRRGKWMPIAHID